jgi:hypothetical protein
MMSSVRSTALVLAQTPVNVQTFVARQISLSHVPYEHGFAAMALSAHVS